MASVSTATSARSPEFDGGVSPVTPVSPDHVISHSYGGEAGASLGSSMFKIDGDGELLCKVDENVCAGTPVPRRQFLEKQCVFPSGVCMSHTLCVHITPPLLL